MGGSSRGIRDVLSSQSFADFVNANEHLKVEIFMRRGHHPYMSSTYINGYVKDVPLRNKDFDHTLSHIESANQQFGRKPLKQSQNRVMSPRKSVQGEWQNEDMWDNYPKHMLERKISIPGTYIEPRPLKEVKDNKRQSDYYTRFLRRKFRLTTKDL